MNKNNFGHNRNNNNNNNNRNPENSERRAPRRDFQQNSRQERDKDSEWKEFVVQISRVTKVVKGGKNLSFRALVVIGDERGSFGVGLGKAAEVVDAVKKAIENAKKDVVKILFDQGSIPHNILGHFNASELHLFKARKGTGLIAAGMVKTALELAGLHNVVCKIHGSTNPANVLFALKDAILKLKTRGQIRQLRNNIAPKPSVLIA